VAAAYGVALAARPDGTAGGRVRYERAREAAVLLEGTRPTAVNLFAALGRMRRVLESAASLPAESLFPVLLREAEAIAEEDRTACRRIGELGASLLPTRCSVLTHCNAGALATAGIGTALGIITTAAAQGKIERVFVDETRPLLQGARLTTWELLRHGIRAILIADSTAGTVLRTGKAQAVIVGADRIAMNGDTANKVGTYPLAVLARRHGVPVYIAAPASTLDADAEDGSGIPIEERDPEELTHFGATALAPAGVEVFSPAFDVTPNELITAIVTEHGVVRAPYADSLRRLVKP
jgi:methylthioribose-1-phosphate isomerase